MRPLAVTNPLFKLLLWFTLGICFASLGAVVALAFSSGSNEQSAGTGARTQFLCLYNNAGRHRGTCGRKSSTPRLPWTTSGFRRGGDFRVRKTATTKNKKVALHSLTWRAQRLFGKTPAPSYRVDFHNERNSTMKASVRPA
jgi:hypothetical protein